MSASKICFMEKKYPRINKSSDFLFQTFWISLFYNFMENKLFWSTDLPPDYVLDMKI